ncbi:uncharacterized protein LOC124597872 [Schistocerca americana]|uniref:uncharacterized protein LOC124597872 n=1 Tax=Schistocerca americana TaxID=7009 RepID=UPI001F4FC634|nr:uncharacterized protein LOC124597872 [Schistocerca americana]
MCRPTIGKESLHVKTNENGLLLISFALMQNLMVISTSFSHKQVQKRTWIFPDGSTVNQVDHLLIGERRKKCVMDVRSYRGADAHTDHVPTIARLRLQLCYNMAKRLFDIEKLKDPEICQQYNIKVRNKFEILASDHADEVSVNKQWEEIRTSVTEAAKEILGEKKANNREEMVQRDM